MTIVPISSSEKCFDTEGNRVNGLVELGVPITKEEADRALQEYYARSTQAKKEQKIFLPIGLDE